MFSISGEFECGAAIKRRALSKNIFSKKEIAMGIFAIWEKIKMRVMAAERSERHSNSSSVKTLAVEQIARHPPTGYAQLTCKEGFAPLNPSNKLSIYPWDSMSHLIPSSTHGRVEGLPPVELNISVD